MTQTLDHLDHAARSPLQWKDMLARLGPLIGLAFVCVLFTLLRPRTFPTRDNIEIMLLQTAVVGIGALGMTLVIIAGGIDLSIGSAIALVTVAVAKLMKDGLPPLTEQGFPPFLAALGGIATGAACGLAIGAMVIGHLGRVVAVLAGGWLAVHLVRSNCSLLWAVPAGLGVLAALWTLTHFTLKRVELSPFIVTLGMFGALRGAAEGLSEQQPIYPGPSWLDTLLTKLRDSESWMLVPPGVWFMLLCALLVASLLRYTRFGRHVFAIGSNEQTARLCGVRVERTKLLIYTLSGIFAGLAGVLQFSYLTGGDPTTAQAYELKIIAAVVIGGASLSGGQGSVLGSLIGALIMTAVDNGCTKLDLSNWVQKIVTGVIIVFAVALDRLRQRGT